MAQRSDTALPRQALIITRSTWEREAVRRHVQDVHEEEEPGGLIFECGTFQGAASAWKIAIVELGLSHLSPAEQVETATRFFAPDVALFVGTALGVGTDLGDVVAATIVLGFDSEAPEWGFDPLPAIEIASPRLAHRARFEAGRQDWQRRARSTGMSSRALVADVATQEAGVADAESWLAYVQSSNLRVAAVDAGFYRALRSLHASSVDTLMVRGVYAAVAPAATKMTRESQIIAAVNAAAFAFQVLAKLGAPTMVPQRSPRAADNPARRYVIGLTIENIRSIRTLEWQIAPERAPGWHVILGDNGSGKSTFLRALALSMLSRTETDALRQDWGHWLKLDAAEGRVVTRLQRMEAVGTGSEKTRSDQETPPSLTERVFRLARVPEDGGEAAGPPSRGVTCTPETAASDAFSVAYGPFRRFSGGDLDFEKELAAYPRLTRHLSLFSERAALTEGLSWLKDLRFKQLEKHPDGHLLDLVRDFINHTSLLPHQARLADVSSEAITFTDGNGCTVPTEELSDGFRSILSMTLDLLRHFTTAFDPADVFSRASPAQVVAPGVVLIDEIDAHLHPTWQHAVGGWFRRHFPNVEFIVATHSPLICQAADSVFLLPEPGSGRTARPLEGVELERVRNGNVLDAYGTGAFGVGVTRSEASKRMLEQLARLNTKELDEGLTAEEEVEQERLRTILPTSGPDELVPHARSAEVSSQAEDVTKGAP